MTNREWLSELTDEQFVAWLIKDYEHLKFASTDTYRGILHWLKDKHRDVSKPIGYYLDRNGNWVAVYDRP